MTPKIQTPDEAIEESSASNTTFPPVKICGIIMPIADMEDYDAAHWLRVRELIETAANIAGYQARIVSESEDIGVIHSRIVQNIYDDPIIVCDVSGKNANVMFELGLRLAFDKPVIIIKDDKTNYSFDTSPIEHLDYRHDLRYQDSVTFINTLAKRIGATVKKKEESPEFSPFLGHFGKFTVAALDVVEGSPTQYVEHRLNEIQRTLDRLVSIPAPSNLWLHSKYENESSLISDKVNLSSEYPTDYLKGILELSLDKVDLQSEIPIIEQVEKNLKENGINTNSKTVNSITLKAIRNRFNRIK